MLVAFLDQVSPTKGSKRIRLDPAVVQTVSSFSFSKCSVSIWKNMGIRSHGTTDNESRNLIKRLRSDEWNLEHVERLRRTPGTFLLPTSFAEALLASKKTQERDLKLSGALVMTSGSPRNASAPIKTNLYRSSLSSAQSSVVSDSLGAPTGSDGLCTMSPLEATMEGEVSTQVLRMNLRD